MDGLYGLFHKVWDDSASKKGFNKVSERLVQVKKDSIKCLRWMDDFEDNCFIHDQC